jgi:hypothetical protein
MTKSEMAPSGAPLPDYLRKSIEQDAGLGVSNEFADSLWPLIGILQTNSPQVDARGPDYIANATAGMFWLRDTNTVHDHLDVVFVAMQDSFIEWQPARGGFVARHATLPDDAEPIRDSNSRRPILVRTNKNLIESSRDIFLLHNGTLRMMPCTSTKNTFARRWNTHLTQQRDPQTGAVLAAFAKKYQLRTVTRRNSLGTWSDPTFTEIGWASKSEYDQAKAFCLSITRGDQLAKLPGASRPQLPPAA